ncbi:MAG: HVO_2523 family zinc finger protein [Haloferacaceae archaeon]
MSRQSDADPRAARSGEGGDASDDHGVDGRPCPLCDASLIRRHCKYVCPQHGVVYDCSDTFW